ncbi:oxidoreductase, partial [bacterium]|nr:oxidoreductase [bacterium]
ASGIMHLEKANVRWFLSINYDVIPEKEKSEGKRTYRSITVDGEEMEFSQGFTELHTVSYDAILNGTGYRIGDTKAAIKIVHDIRHAVAKGLQGDYHPLAKYPLSKHPFSKRIQP